MSAAVERLRSKFEELAAIGGEPDGGVSRLAYGALERQAHGRFAEWVRGLGGRIEEDGFGNTIGVIREGEPYMLVGSHLDSVQHGGRYDGTVGVLAGLELAERLADSCPGPLRVVAFAAEEGARFGRPCLGSSLAVGALTPEQAGELRDAEGMTLTAAAAESGLDLGTGRPWLHGEVVLAFLEVHIEQGRVLEEHEAVLGVVDGIAGSARLRVTLTGLAEHSGSTPMDIRRDALCAAAEVVLGMEQLARAERDLRATVGALSVHPGGPTTIPGRVVLLIDLRETDPERQRVAERAARAMIAEVATRRQIEVEVEVVSRVSPVLLSAWPRRALQEAVEQRGIRYRVMASGAGHDAALVARTAPSALLFVPCAGGRSHSPEESCRVDDVAVAVDVLGDAVVRLFADARRAGKADRPDPVAH